MVMVPAVPFRSLSVRGGTASSNPVSSTGESKPNPISWIMVDADAKKLTEKLTGKIKLSARGGLPNRFEDGSHADCVEFLPGVLRAVKPDDRRHHQQDDRDQQ